MLGVGYLILFLTWSLCGLNFTVTRESWGSLCLSVEAGMMIALVFVGIGFWRIRENKS